MSFNYINKPKLYNTGFISVDKNSRYVQGLLPQELTNDCFIGLNKTIPKNRNLNKQHSLTNTPFLNNDFYGNYSINKANMLANPYYNNEKFPHEANYLKLDCNKANNLLNWYPKWNLDQTLEKIVTWYKVYQNHENLYNITKKQIEEYMI
jgi:hypothetical protein